MNCWHCKKKLIWGGDYDFEDYNIDGNGIVTNFSCSNCESYALVYLPIDGESNEYSKLS